jgi:hypothetical protein
MKKTVFTAVAVASMFAFAGLASARCVSNGLGGQTCYNSGSGYSDTGTGRSYSSGKSYSNTGGNTGYGGQKTFKDNLNDIGSALNAAGGNARTVK